MSTGGDALKKERLVLYFSIESRISQLLWFLAQPFILQRNKYVMQNYLSYTSLLADDSSL